MIKPTRQDLEEARRKTVPDVVARELRVLFCGINPGLYSAATGHHFARPGNRFWPALHQSGFTDRQLSPAEERELLKLGYGITNIVPRATATADELTKDELLAGQLTLAQKLKRFRPRVLAVLGVGAYRTAFQSPAAGVGSQPDRLFDTAIWVLPNPSGLNAHYQTPELTRQFIALRESIRG